MLLFAACVAAGPPPPAPPPGPLPSGPSGPPPAVLLEAAGGLAAGTAVEVVSTATARTAYEEELPTTRRVRVAGRELDVPARSVALPTGEPLSGDLDGDDRPDRAWLAATDARSDSGDDVYPHEWRQVVVAAVGGRLLVSPERVGGGCSGESDDALRLADATGDGRVDLIVMASSYVCEAGGDSSTWEVLRVGAAGLDVAARVRVPRYPGVGRVNVGEITWWPGGAESVVIEPAGEGTGEPLQRTVTRFRWADGALLSEASAVGPVRATLGAAEVEVTGASGGTDTAAVRVGGVERRVPLADLRFVDPFFPAELDAATGPGVVELARVR